MQLILKNIDFGYNHENILSSFNIEINEKEFVSIIGLSGCGKSTLLNLIAGFIAPSNGEILFENQPVFGTSSERVMVFQEDAVFPWYNVFDNVSYSSKIGNTQSSKEVINDIILEVGLNEFSNYYPKELSGGMKKRVDLARAYAAEPKLLLMDEPFGSLDSYTRQKMQNLLLNLWRKNKTTILFVTHDITEAIYLSDRVILMNNIKGNIQKEFVIDIKRPREHEIKKSRKFLNLWSEIENELIKIEND